LPRQAQHARNAEVTVGFSEYKDLDDWGSYRYEHCRKTAGHAKTRGIEFRLDPDTLVYPDVCPILNIPISRKLEHNNLPSLDRVNNSVGYVNGNVRVISTRANTLKGEMTIEDVERLLAYMKA
jgi:hypothetical protein